MVDISTELAAIKNSVYGKDMRTAIHDAINKVNNDSSGGGGGGGGSSVKTLTYTGNGSETTSITFPETPTIILSIDGPGTGTGMVSLASFRYGSNAVSGAWSDTANSQTGTISLRASVSNNVLTLSGGQNVGARCNISGETYTVVYI